jgi:hypothetical protein
MGTQKWGTYYHGVNQLWEHYKNLNRCWFRVYPMYIQWIVGSVILKKIGQIFHPKKKKTLSFTLKK